MLVPVQYGGYENCHFFFNSQNDQCPVGLIAQLVGHCTGITEAMDLNPVQA